MLPPPAMGANETVPLNPQAPLQAVLKQQTGLKQEFRALPWGWALQSQSTGPRIGNGGVFHSFVKAKVFSKAFL